MTIKHILWDWNGTLLDDVSLCVEATNYLLSQNNLPSIDSNYYREHFTFPVNIFYAKLGLDIKKNYQHFSKLWNDYYQHEFSLQLPIRLEAKQVLEKITTLAIDQSILSASERGYLMTSLAKLNLANHFKYIYGNDGFIPEGKLKNAQKLVKKLAFPSKEILLIGDTDHDYDICQKLGLSCLIFQKGHVNPHRLNQLNVPKIANLNQVIDYL